MSREPFDAETLQIAIARQIGMYEDQIGNASVCNQAQRDQVVNNLPIAVNPLLVVRFLTGNASLRLMTVAQQKGLFDWLKSPVAQEEARAVMQTAQAHTER